MIKLVISDFDDTLCLTEAQTFELENEIVSQMNLPRMSREAHLRNWGMELRLAIAERVPGINADEFLERLSNQIPTFAKLGKLDNIPTENILTLKQLKKVNKKISILTSREEKEISHLLDKKHPLNKCIDAFYHKGNLNFYKPHPKTFVQVLDEFKVIASEAVYIGDTPNDAICAKAGGLHFIASLEGKIRSKEDFKNLNVDYFVNSFTEVTKVVKKLDKYKLTAPVLK